MRSHVLTFVATAVVASAFSVHAYASTVVYSQDPNTSFSETSAVKNLVGDPGFTWSLNQDEEVWTYFKVATDMSFNRISWYGSNADGDFAIDFYSATCGSCGINLVDTDGHFTHDGLYSQGLMPDSGPFTQAQVHKTLVAGGIYSYYIDLTSAINLDPDNAYYALSVVNNYSASPFEWSGSDVGTAGSYRYIVGSPIVQSLGHYMSFTLTDTSVVPLPAAFWLFGSGLAGLVGIAGKRKAA